MNPKYPNLILITKYIIKFREAHLINKVIIKAKKSKITPQIAQVKQNYISQHHN